jgi:hypothetical protein
MGCILFALYMFCAGVTAEYLSGANRYESVIAVLFWAFLWPLRVVILLVRLLAGSCK